MKNTTRILIALSVCVFVVSITVANALTPKEELGKRLFFDTRLSDPPKQSCASCHSPISGFADPRSELPVSSGAVPGRYGSRNAPSAAYAAFSPALYYNPNPPMMMMEGMYIGGQFWDGRANSLEEQAMAPFLNQLEMHNKNKTAVISRVRTSDYASLFKQVFGNNSLNNADSAYVLVAAAIAEYERSSEVCSFTSKYDAYLARRATLTSHEDNGRRLFSSRAMCKNCHWMTTNNPSGKQLFTSYGYQNLGIPKNLDNPFYQLPQHLNPLGFNYTDYGIGAILGLPDQMGRFKIPTLRNVAMSAPYTHNGYFDSIIDVVHYINTRDVGDWPVPEVDVNVHGRGMGGGGMGGGGMGGGGMGGGGGMMRVGNLGLTPQEEEDIVAFLNTLTDGYVP